MKIQQELTLLIQDLMESDQPAEEIAHQVVRVIREKDIDYIIRD